MCLRETAIITSARLGEQLSSLFELVDFPELIIAAARAVRARMSPRARAVPNL